MQDLYAQALALMDQEEGRDPASLPSAPEGRQSQDLEPESAGDGSLMDTVGRSIEGAHGLWQAAGAGIAKAGLETKDFLFGEPEESEKSDLRKAIEHRSDDLRENVAGAGLVEGIAQFTTGMIGAGKLMAPIKGVQKLKAAGKAGQLAYETARGTVAGAVVIDPHEERLSNLIQSYPDLQNPVTEFLAADPNDSAVMGRLKNALEGIGMDVALAGTFAASVKALKLVRGGDHAAAAKVMRDAGKADNTSSGQANWERTRGIETNGRGPDSEAPGTSPSASRHDGPSTSEASGPLAEPQSRFGADKMREQAAATDASPEPTESKTHTNSLADDDISTIIATAQNDYKALRTFGNREEAIAQGHRFADVAKLPWHKLRGTEEVRTFVDATADHLKGKFNATKGGDILSDAHLREMVQERAALFGEEPADILGQLSQAGDNARTMAADMEASFLLANKMLQDAYDVAFKVRVGLLDEWAGSAERAGTELKRRLQAATDLLASAQSMRAASGRAMRRLRGQHQITPAEIDAIKEMDAAKLAEALYATKGNPKLLAKAVNPSFLRRVVDEATFSLTNSLLWLYPTHAVNLTTNLYMLVARPAEKLLGSLAVGADGSAIRRQAIKEYAYTVASLGDGWEAMVDAFKRGDSALSPHTDEYFGGSHKALAWKEVRSPADLLENGWRALSYRTIVGLPTRSLGAVDEFMKTLRYRAVVQASAVVEAESRGLSGTALHEFVERRLAQSFDEAGGALNRAALQEAQTSTFQQELLQGTAGATARNVRATHPSLALVFPYIKTPINVFRYSWKMTPGLNLIQTEYREMLKGGRGVEAQAQAVGQMVLGATFMGIAATLVAQGRITGGGPKDPELLATLKAAGWQPYSIVWTGDDGKRRFFPLGRFDPVGLPLGIVADLVDVQRLHPNKREQEKGAQALGLALARNFSDKTFLANINHLLRAASDPETQLAKFAGQAVGNAIPLSSLLRGTNPDPYIREARGFVDNMLRNLPGYSTGLPPRRDAFGEPVWSRIGLASTEDSDLVEAEHNRIILETGYGMRPPAPTHRGVDFRDLTLSDGRNAYDVVQELTANPPGHKPLKEALASLITSKGYQHLVDGDPVLKGTKLGAITDVVAKYRAAAFKLLLRKYPEVRKAVLKAQIDVKAAIDAKREKSHTTPTEKMLREMGY